MAKDCFETALEDPKCDFRVWGYLGQTLITLKKYNEANDCFTRLIMGLDEELRKDPENIFLLREKAKALSSMGLKDNALNIYDKILGIDPSADFIQEDLRRLGVL